MTKYQCAICQTVCKKERTDEDAENEMREIWGEIPEEERAIICEDCWNKRTMKEIREMGNDFKGRMSAPGPDKASPEVSDHGYKNPITQS